MVTGSRNLKTHGHGKRFWKARDPGHRLGKIAAPRQLKLSGSGMRRLHGWDERQPQKSIGGGARGVWLSQVGDVSQLPMLTVAGAEA